MPLHVVLRGEVRLVEIDVELADGVLEAVELRKPPRIGGAGVDLTRERLLRAGGSAPAATTSVTTTAPTADTSRMGRD